MTLNILIAPSGFKESLGADAVAEHIARGELFTQAVGHGAEVFAEDDGLVAVRFQRQQTQQIVHRVIQVRTVGGRRGDAQVHTRVLQRPLLFVWLLMGVCLLSMPFSGWWLVHLIGWPLGQTWILGSSILYTVAALAWFWLVARLNRLRKGEGGSLNFTLVLAVVSLVPNSIQAR